VGAAAPELVTTLPAVAVSGLTAGLDWAKDDHAVAVVDHTGREVRRHTVAHSRVGLHDLVRKLRAAGVGTVVHDPRCTYEDPQLFSHRRDGVTGRQAGLVWLAP